MARLQQAALRRVPGKTLLAVIGSLIGASVLAVAVAGGVTAANGACLRTIAGTYYRPADFLITLDRDNSLVGQYSRTTQEGPAGVGETFSGRWTCAGNNVKIQQFRFLEASSTRYVERGNAVGTFDGSRTLTLTYTFHSFAETDPASDLRSATGDVVSVPALTLTRVSKP